MNLIGIMIGLLVTAIMSLGAYDAVESSMNATRAAELVTQIDQLSIAMRAYDTKQCMLFGYQPNGQPAPSCAATDWPSQISQIVASGFLPTNYVAVSPLPVGGQTEPFLVGGTTPYLGFISVTLPNAVICNGVESHFTSSKCAGNVLTVYVPRNENSGWNLANSGNIIIPSGL